MAELPFALDPLDPKLVLAKPQHSIKEALATRLEGEGNLIITRKRDGNRAHIVLLPNGIVRIYSRGIDDITERFPWIVEALQRRVGCMRLPALLDGELIAVTENDSDDFPTLTMVMKRSPLEAQNLQRSKGPVRFLLLDAPVWAGKSTSTLSAQERLALVSHVVTDIEGHDRPWPVLYVPPILDHSLGAARLLVREKKWEGFVLYHREAR
ncbi:MAG: hypothetical protein AAB538_01770, partial [Patescibacteria group bacterium]